MICPHRACQQEEDDYDDGFKGECQRCHGEGVINICPDDLCHGSDECIHGDGIVTCPDCKGML